jgi:hypothetical protein
VRDTQRRAGICRGILKRFGTQGGEMSLTKLSNHLCLSLEVVEDIFQFVGRKRLY